MKLEEELQPNFILGQKVDQLVSMTIDLCTKKKNEDNPRFPYKLYNTYVDRILKTALDIQKSVYIANELHGDERFPYIKAARGNNTYLLHLIRIAYEHKWISDKQRECWSGVCVSIKYKLKNWK